MKNFNLSLLRCMQYFFLLLATYSLYPQNTSSHCEFSSTSIDANTLSLTIYFTIPSPAHLYADYIKFSVDNPAVTLSNWTSTYEPRVLYDETFKTTKKLFDQNVGFSAQAHITNPLTSQARLHVAYYLNSNSGIVEESFPLFFSNSPGTQQTVACVKTSVQTSTASTNTSTKYQSRQHIPSASYSDTVAVLITQTSKLWLRLLLVFLMGILMSLTPCIYPMIPITIGILQVQGSRSLFKNIFVSLAYTFGIATTFALFGLAAATTGLLFGSLLANPIVILCIVLLLAYLGLAMFGFYEMYVPSFLKSRSIHTGNGSLASAFLFGVASGSVASPCLSPGLVLLLSIVATLKSNLLGFMLLFVFGIGLSVPLLIIGTFSSSLSLLPRAGIWMVEVKKLFGFMLFGMCFYFLKPIIPAPVLLSMITLFLTSAGLFYLYSERKKSATLWKNLYGLLGILLLASALIIATQAYKTYLITQECIDCSQWHNDYAKAVAIARECNQKLFIDVGASFCSICTAIDKKILSSKVVDAALIDFCCVKIDGANDPENVCKQLQKTYGIIGFPTFLLIDAKTGALLKRWGSELYDVSPEAFAQELAQIAQKK